MEFVMRVVYIPISVKEKAYTIKIADPSEMDRTLKLLCVDRETTMYAELSAPMIGSGLLYRMVYTRKNTARNNYRATQWRTNYDEAAMPIRSDAIITHRLRDGVLERLTDDDILMLTGV